MKKILVFLLIASIFASSCAAKKETVMERTNRDGKLVLGCSADYPPFEFHAVKDGKDEIVGFDIDLGRAIAKDMGLELEVRDMSFDGLLAALMADKIDMVISGMTPTPERAQSVDFSDIYYHAEQGAVIRAADAEKFARDKNSIADRPIAAQKGAIQSEIAKVQVKGMTSDEAKGDHPQVKELPTLLDMIAALRANTVDALIVEVPVARPYVETNPDLMIADYRFPVDETGSAVAIKKGNEDFVEKVNASLKRLLESGELDKMISNAYELANAQ